MKQSLSEQLARLCNIKPKIVLSSFSLRDLLSQKSPEYEEIFPDFCTYKNTLKLIHIICNYFKCCKDTYLIDFRDLIPSDNAVEFCLNELRNPAISEQDKTHLINAIQNCNWDWEEE